MRFNAPPNWPVAADWIPEPGWTPDPTWPPAPAGWQFWVDDFAPAPAAQPETGPPQVAPPAYQGAPQWQPPAPVPGPVGPPRRNNRNVLILAGVAVVVVIGVVVALVVGLGGGSSKPKSDEDQIRATLSAIESAWNSGDYKAFASHVCGANPSVNAGEDEFQQERKNVGDVSFEVTNIKVTGDTAKVEVTGKSSLKGEDSSNSTFDFKKTDGEWKWCVGNS